jgi:hypothetical protein
MPAGVEAFAAWVALGLGASFLYWAAPRLWGFLMGALADKIVEGLEGKLAPTWQADLEDALAPLYRDLKMSEGASKWPNGSGNLPDSMKEIYRRVDEIQRWVIQPPQHDTFDEPDGTPI